MSPRWLAVCALIALGCSSEEKPAEAAPEILHATLDLDIRDQADVELALRGEGLTARITLTKGFDVAPAGTELRGDGHVERFPEAEVTLYTATFAVDAQGGGPCGDQPLTLALALHRRGTGQRLSGSLTPYCGEQIRAGIPARSPLRITGNLDAAPAEP